MLHHPNYGSNVTPLDDDNNNNNDTVVVPNTVVQKPIMTSSRTGTTSSATVTATATRTGRRRFLLAGGALIGTTCTVTFGLLLKGYGFPMTLLLRSSGLEGDHSCCAVEERDYCKLVGSDNNGWSCQSTFPEDAKLVYNSIVPKFVVPVHKGESCSEYNLEMFDPSYGDWTDASCKDCYFSGGTNGPRCCTEKDHKTWYPLALHPKCH